MAHRVSILLTVLFALAAVPARLASPVDAATVSLGLISKQTARNDLAGEWELWAWTSLEDNDGLSAYSVEMLGDGIAGEHMSPIVIHEGSPSTIGFSGLRQPIPSASLGSTLLAAQNSTNLVILYGVGSPDVSARIMPFDDPYLNQRWWLNDQFMSSPGTVPGDNPFLVPDRAAQLAVGTSLDYTTVEIGANLANVYFYGEASIYRTEVNSAQMQLFVDHVPAVPEPSWVVLSLLTCISWAAFTRSSFELYARSRITWR